MTRDELNQRYRTLVERYDALTGAWIDLVKELDRELERMEDELGRALSPDSLFQSLNEECARREQQNQRKTDDGLGMEWGAEHGSSDV